MLEQAEPYGLRRVTFVGGDNHSAIIEVADLAGSYLAWSGEHYWHFVSERYPINTAIKDIKEIIVEGDGSHGLHITTYGRDYPVLSPGQMLGSSHWLYFHEQELVLNGWRALRKTDLRCCAAARDPAPPAQRCWRSQRQHAPAGMESYVDLWERIHPINLTINRAFLRIGARSAEDASPTCFDVLDRVERVVPGVLDGFGYPHEVLLTRTWRRISSTAQSGPGLSVYVPITNCGCAAMLSGETLT